MSDKILESYVHEIERLLEERKSINAQITEVYKNSAGFGYDKKAMREVIRKRKQALDEMEQEEELVQVYKHALGMYTGN